MRCQYLLLVLFTIGAGLVLGGFALRALRLVGMAGDIK